MDDDDDDDHDHDHDHDHDDDDGDNNNNNGGGGGGYKNKLPNITEVPSFAQREGSWSAQRWDRPPIPTTTFSRKHIQPVRNMSLCHCVTLLRPDAIYYAFLL
jgi:ABC-type Zn2+ transport system substrate-binding protein/surface adhesin